MKKLLFILLALLAYTGAWAQDFSTAYVKGTNGTSVTWKEISGTINGTKFTVDGMRSLPKAEVIDLNEVWSGEGTGTHYTVTGIGEYAFDDDALTSIVIPSSVTSIGMAAFSRCDVLTEIKVEAGNTKYDSRNNCNAIIEKASNTLITGCKNTVIPETVTSIGNHAFDECTGLTSIELPNGVTKIGEGAFSGCTGLASIKLPSSLTRIEGQAFENCESLTSIIIPNGVKSILTGTFYGCSKLISVDLPSTVGDIGDYAFGGCTGLTSIEIPGVYYIGRSAFGGCSKLTNVIINSTSNNMVLSIKDYAFRGCSALETFVLKAPILDGLMPSSVFEGCELLKTIYLNAGGAPQIDEYSIKTNYCPLVEIKQKLFLNTDIATFSSGYNWDFTNADVRAYIITGYEDGKLKTERVMKVPANTGVLVSGVGGTDYDLTETTDVAAVGTNLLRPTDGSYIPTTEGTNTNYILTLTSDGKYTFVRLAEAGVIAKGKAYLPLPTSAASNSFVIDFSSQTDGIKTATTADDGKATIYDLQGSRVEKAEKGIYIVNGKKMLVK